MVKDFLLYLIKTLQIIKHEMNEIVVEVLRYIGITNCLFLGIRLLRNRNNPSNIFFAILLFLLGVNLYFLNNLDNELLEIFPEVIILIDWFPFAYAPLIFLYIKGSIEIPQSYSIKVMGKHFIMSVVNTLYLIILYGILQRSGFTAMVQSILKGNYPWFFYLSMGIKIAYSLGYFILIVFLLWKKRRILRISSENKSRRNWFISLFLGLALCYFSPLLDLFLELNLMYESLTIVFFVLWIYLAVYYAMQNPNVFHDAKVVQKIRMDYYNSEEHREVLRQDIERLFVERKIHLRMDLNLQTFAKEWKQPVNRASFYINDIFQVHFTELVNQYRLKEFLSLLKDRNGANILDLALESGFNSKTSFNRIFKKHFQLTPSQYIKKIKK